MKEQELIEKIKKMRSDNGMSQEQLAQLAGVTRVYINNIENGKKEVSEH